MARTKTRSAETSIHLRGEDWIVTGTCTKGSPAYFDRSFGNWLPGDPAEVEDVELLADGHDGVLRVEDLTAEELAQVEEALTIEADVDEREAWEDEMDRRADADRDDRLLGEGRYARSEP